MILLDFGHWSRARKSKWVFKETRSTWYQIQAAITGMETIKTCHATWDITAMIPRSMIASKARPPTRSGICISSALWSLEA
jgi:type IV secretory pathway ATPase VirB11/archaellum biosynthesis ATPase